MYNASAVDAEGGFDIPDAQTVFCQNDYVPSLEEYFTGTFAITLSPSIIN